jgi:hypothetical protein
MLIKILIILSVSIYGSLILGELIAMKKPTWKISKWWRKYIIDECKKCD